MVVPVVLARMKQRNNLASFGIPASDVGAFALIAVQAGKCQIVSAGCSAVLPGDDMVDVKGTHVRECRQVAIFTPPIGPLPDVTDQILIQELRTLRMDSKLDWFKATRARECITDKTFAILTYPSSSAVSSSVNVPSFDFSINSCMRAWSASPKSMDIRYRAASGEIADSGAWMSRAHMAGSKSTLTLPTLMIPVYDFQLPRLGTLDNVRE
jgi:hypothetical protein